MTGLGPASDVVLPDPRYYVAWQPNSEAQVRAMRAREFEVFYGGAKGGGKSDWLIAEAPRQVQYAAYKALVLRETYPQVAELIRRSHRLYTNHPMKPAWNGSDKAWVFPDPESPTGSGAGAVIQFGYCRTPEDAERYQGHEWGGVFFDELANIPQERVWTELLKEIRCRDPRVVRVARCTGNPGYAGHAWCKRRFITATDEGRKLYSYDLPMPDGSTYQLQRRFVPARVVDNPVYANDPQYLAVLNSLPEARRKQLLHGDWDVGLGLALEELDEAVHIVEPFAAPAYWKRIGGFDWGFQHKWVAMNAAVDEDSNIWVIDTAKGWRDLPHEIANTMRHRLDIDSMRYMAAGHDTWHERRARGENAPSVAERLTGKPYHIPLVKANQDRIHGLNNLRDYISYKGRGRDGVDIDAGLRFMDTPNNRWLFEQCRDMVVDPDDPERPLKVDANPDTGEGGDDGFDALRYMVASRPPRAPDLALRRIRGAWDREVLAYELEQMMRVRSKPARQRIDHLTTEIF